ncbi:hypothetical protein V6N13_126489 [Hibiscus sabdariffa]
MAQRRVQGLVTGKVVLDGVVVELYWWSVDRVIRMKVKDMFVGCWQLLVHQGIRHGRVHITFTGVAGELVEHGADMGNGL